MGTAPEDLDAALLGAVRDNDTDGVRELLAAGADPNVRFEGRHVLEFVHHRREDIKVALIEAGAWDDSLEDALVWVVGAGTERTMQKLIEGGADVNVPAIIGTPLSVAAGHGELGMIRLLLRAGADVDAGNLRATPLSAAISAGHEDCALELLEGGASHEIMPRMFPTTLLCLAASRGLSRVVEALLARGVPVDAPGEKTLLAEIEPMSTARPAIAQDATPLCVAARNGHAEVVRRLLAAGADPHRRDGKGRSAVEWAEAEAHGAVLDVFAGLEVAAAERTPDEQLLEAASKQDAPQIEAALAAGANPNARDSRTDHRNWTSLIHLVRAGDETAVGVLLEAGADVTLRDEDEEHRATVRTIYAHGGDEGLELTGTQLGRTALHHAAAAGQAGILRQLVAAGGVVDDVDFVGMAPLHLGAAAGHVDVVQTAIDSGADLKLRASGRRTALHVACEDAPTESVVPVATVLLDAGVKVDLKDGDGRTALWHAADRGHGELLRLLLARKAKVDLASKDWGTPLVALVGASRREPIDESEAFSGNFSAVHWTDDGVFADLPLPADELLPLLDLLLEAGADVNAVSALGPPISQAARRGQVAVVRRLLDAGADPGLTCEDGMSAADYAKLYDHPDVLAALGVAPDSPRAPGALESDEAPEDDEAPEADGEDVNDGEDGALDADRWGPDVPAPDFATRGEDPRFRAHVQEIAATCGSKARAVKESPGCFSIHIKRSVQESVDVEALQDRAKEHGAFVFAPRYAALAGAPESVMVVPTTDPFEAVALMQTNGANEGIGPGRILEWLRALEATQPFRLTTIAHDTLAGRFLGEIEDPAGLAASMYELCSDIVHQGTGTVEALAQELERSQRLFFWWD